MFCFENLVGPATKKCSEETPFITGERLCVAESAGDPTRAAVAGKWASGTVRGAFTRFCKSQTPTDAESAAGRGSGVAALGGCAATPPLSGRGGSDTGGCNTS
mmetsp:Transcript_46489/g.123465  ORF Transcript_46489/g.123465 Transcript_46489/m.123465 type:complete len:103 (-) Transcript_46489:160-468(-)|eukprot:CAMPEP_0194488554 /NCGR_PEP_ID=MMETSP0253-20130528/8437_1 /TAXON_ID=2966 /ORGANISM="Noctiluca scintillans" /LENGTH=102 /DNA_ID=CAMNT_0039328935 /DNA_START=254 /DNA_END=562 /DNA_ORIENTATION=+